MTSAPPPAAGARSAPGAAATDAQAIAALLARYRFTFTNEKMLQQALADLLMAQGYAVTREAVLGPQSRCDFLLGALAIEVKIQGTPAGVVRQLMRYADLPAVEAVLLVTTRRRLALALPDTLRGKPLLKAVLPGAFV